MKKKLKDYLRYDYPIRIVRYPDGMYCAEIEDVEGLCAYGATSQQALKHLDEVKEAAFELMLSQGTEPPIPTVRIEIPMDEFKRNANFKKLKEYVKV